MKYYAGKSELELNEMRAAEAKERDAAYEKLSAELGEDAVDALKAHFAIYDERVYLWVASLYDPGEYDANGNPLGGGFYYTKSAKETDGYAIDIESTEQVFSFLSECGMLRGKRNDVLPEKMIKEVVAFAHSLQSPDDGYFYHKQWGKDIGSSRQSRDLGWATHLLSAFGYQPYWNAPDGTKGMYGDPGKKTKSQSESINVDKWPDRLKTLEAWEQYLKDFEPEIATRSYPIGHEVAEQRSQIKNRDAEALANGEPTGYVALTEHYFNKWRNKETGLWEDKVAFSSVNGLMKIMAIYEALGLRFEYATEAFESVLKLIALEDTDESGVKLIASTFIYNPWCALSRIFNCLKSQGDTALLDELRARLRKDAARLIRITTKKAKKFQKPDGSYGFRLDYSHSHQQGVPSAVPNTVEGDIDGGLIAVNAVTLHMMIALGIYKTVYIYYPSDLYVFLEELSKNKHKDKKIVSKL